MTPDAPPPSSSPSNDPRATDAHGDPSSDDSPIALRTGRGGYSIGEVGDHLDLEAHVLRYWESEFDELMPKKDAAGRRVYTDADIRTLQRIRHLLKEERYTIAGARAVLDREGVHGRKAFRDDLRDLRDFLVDLKNRI
jgi:DNA-binding transcriptional MerR regulator